MIDGAPENVKRDKAGRAVEFITTEAQGSFEITWKISYEGDGLRPSLYKRTHETVRQNGDRISVYESFTGEDVPVKYELSIWIPRDEKYDPYETIEYVEVDKRAGRYKMQRKIGDSSATRAEFTKDELIKKTYASLKPGRDELRRLNAALAEGREGGEINEPQSSLPLY